MVFGRAKAQAACTVTVRNGVHGYIHIEGCGTNEVVGGSTAKGKAPAGTTTDAGCIGYSQNRVERTFGNGDNTPTPGAGECHQIDICSQPLVNGICQGTSYGVVLYGDGGGLSCGDKCTTTAECRNPSANGSPVACINGTCQNTMCAVGMTIPGANCSCGANLRKCGQTCSATLGLCAPGQGACTYVNTAGPVCPFGWSQTYCAGSSNGYKLAACTTGDAPGGSYLVGPTGKTSGLTAAEIADSCSVCGNGTVEGSEQCDDGAANGSSTSMCTAVTCKKVTCNQTCTDDSTCGGVLHTVTIQASLTATQDFAFDYILDKGVYAEAAPLINWSLATGVIDASAHLGTYIYSNTNNAAIVYKTYSPVITLRTATGPRRGAIKVLVDGVLKQTIAATTLVGPTKWIDISIPVATASKYTCYNSGTTKNCRLSANPQSATCSGVVTTTPTPTPSSLVCDLTPTFTSTGNVSNWKYGDSITYSVGAVPATRIPAGGSVRYEGEYAAYRGTTLMKKLALTPINATASKFNPIKVEYGNSNYYFHFRYCVKTSAGVETCSPWGAWAVPATATATPVSSPITCAPAPVCPAGSALIYGDPQNGGCPAYQCSTLPAATPLPVNVVKWVNTINTGSRPNMTVDYIKEGTTILENTSNRLQYVGSWALNASSPTASGGNVTETVQSGDSVSLVTTAPTVAYRTQTFNTRSEVTVYVNNVLRTTLTNLYVGFAWVEFPVTLY